MTKTFGSVCDGIGCGHLGFTQAGMTCVWSSEIEEFPNEVLAVRFPDVPRIGDMRGIVNKLESDEITAPDVLIGGTPCQAFSVAGKRKGMDDERGNLSLEFCRIADAIDAVRHRAGRRPCAVLWENAPGVLHDKGNAFGCLLGELSGAGCALVPAGKRWTNAGCVFGPARTLAWRIVDSQYWGVPQRRRRLFLVASAGAFCPESVLFEPESVRRDSPPSREARQKTTPDLVDCLTACGGDGGRIDKIPHFVEHTPVCPTLRAGGNRTGGDRPPGTDVDTVESLVVETFRMLAFGEYASDNTESTLKQRDHKDATDLIVSESAMRMSIRRITPKEAERLQALPDDWTKIVWNGKQADRCADGPRYKAVGNGQTVSVMRWLAKRIKTELERTTEGV